MKTLYLLRHAKSSWDYPDLKDFERPLNGRGLRDVPVMADRFNARNCTVDCIVCSPAVRAKTTAGLFSEAVNFKGGAIVSNPELYFAGVGMFLKAAKLMDSSCNTSMLVGHNPAITEFVNAMTGEAIENIPTCGFVQMELAIDDWADASLGSARLIEFDFPKKQS
jgi:phosphohistidine phosphatase